MNSKKILRNIFRLQTIFPKKLCTESRINEFTAVYNFPYIRPAALVNRLKFYQSALTGISIPGSIILYNFGVLSGDTVINTCVLGITGTVSLFLFGLLPHKLIGFVYIKNDNKVAKISYLNFWGKREDKEVPISDLVPLSDLPVVPTDPLFLTMRRFSTSETYKINLKYGIVLEKSKFNTVFLQDI